MSLRSQSFICLLLFIFLWNSLADAQDDEIILEEDFEDGSISRDISLMGTWEIATIDGEHVLQTTVQDEGVSLITETDGFSDYTVEMKLRVSDNVGFVLVNRVDSFDDLCSQGYVLDYDTESLNFQSFAGDDCSIEAIESDITYSLPTNEWVTIRVELFENEFRFYSNDELIFETDALEVEYGHSFGFFIFDPTTIEIDYLAVFITVVGGSTNAGSDGAIAEAIADTILFTEPSFFADIMTFLAEGEEVAIIGMTADGQWYQVDLFGEVGWVSAQDVSVSGDIDEIAVIQISPSSPTSTFQPTVTPTSPGATQITPTLPNTGGGPEIYTVQAGDTLQSIAAQYDIPLETLLHTNNLNSADEIAVGQALVIMNPTKTFSPQEATRISQTQTAIAQIPTVDAVVATQTGEVILLTLSAVSPTEAPISGEEPTAIPVSATLMGTQYDPQNNAIILNLELTGEIFNFTVNIINQDNNLLVNTYNPTPSEQIVIPAEGLQGGIPYAIVITGENAEGETFRTESPLVISSPTATPNPVQTTTAAAFDAQATSDSATATAAPTEIAEVEIGEAEFEVVDELGTVLGSGVVRLLSPAEMRLGESSEIRVEIQVNPPAPDVLITLQPPPSATPNLGTVTPRPTPTPLPISDIQFVEVREYMGARLGGVDSDNFEIDSVPPNGLRRINPSPQVVNWWKWNIRPKSVGTHRLEVVIYIPITGRNGEQLEHETNLIPFTIEVTPDGAATLKTGDSDSNTGLFALIGLVLIAGVGLAGYTLTKRRPRHKIFISYRRADSQGFTGRIYDRLAAKFGGRNVFMDVEAIEYGENFVHAIDEAVGNCDVLIAVIGREWLNLKNTGGLRRLDDPEDYVRLEIVTALKKGVRVIPALVDNAEMPMQNDLPNELRELSLLNAISLRNDSFDYDIQRLIDALTAD